MSSLDHLSTPSNSHSSSPEVLILAGGDISDRLPFIRATSRCPALLPVRTRYLGATVVEVHKNRGATIRLFVDAEFEHAVSGELDAENSGILLHGLPDTQSVIESLRLAVEYAESEELIINLVTTVPTEIPEMGEVQVADVPRRGNWAAISNDNGEIKFHPKGSPNPGNGKAFTGVFRARRQPLKDALEECSEGTDLLQVIELLNSHDPIHLRTVEWLDFGHEVNYHNSLASLISSRSFNSIKVDVARGAVTKASEDVFKLTLEANYLEGLPEPLKVLFPRVLSRRNGVEGTESYEMEYYGYPTLGEYLLFWDISQEAWWRCFEGIDKILQLFLEYPASIGPAASREFLAGKTIRRIEEFLADPGNGDFAKRVEGGELTLNGKKLPPLSSIVECLEAVFESSYSEDHFCVFHGDLCFNNILFDHGSGVVRLIDPRGSYGERFPGIYGDRRYDLAKLAHSSIGGYDYLVNGLYQLSEEGSNFKLHRSARRADVWIGEMTSWLVGRHCEDPIAVKMMMAGLFLSMCPLHADDPRRQKALFLRGMELYSECL